jgi:probable phosphoglycerate mutase
MQERLLLMRHGETEWNAEHRFTTHSDVELSPAGIAQAEEAAAALAGERLDRIFSSPMQRARRTAELVAAVQERPPDVAIDDRLVEIDAGPFDGQTTEELQSGPLAGAFHAWHTDGEPVFPDGTETFDDALRRVSAFFDDRAGLPGTTLVVTHGSLARLAICSHFLGGPPPYHRRLWLDNCRLTCFENRDGIHKMVAFNAKRLSG